MKAFYEILGLTVKGLGINRRYYAEMVIFYWRRIVGDNVANHTCPVKVQRGVLVVGTSSAVWSHHLLTLKGEIIAKINDFAGEKVVSDIKFQAGYLKNDQNEENTDEYQHFSITWKNAVLSPEDVHRIERLTENLSDDVIRQKMKNILRKDFALRQVKRKNNWRECSICGILCPPGREICPVCSVEKRQREREKLLNLLDQAPWMSYKECSGYVDCLPTDFNTAKNDMIDKLKKKLDNNESNQLILATIVMLVHSVKPDEITEDMLVNILDKIRGKKYVSAPRR